MAAIRVRAIRKAFYYGMRQPGEIFVLHDESALGSWMELVDPADLERLGDKLGEIQKKRGIKLPKPGADKAPPTPVQLRIPIGPPVSKPAAGPKPTGEAAPAGTPAGKPLGGDPNEL